MRQKVRTFSSEGAKVKKKSTDGKVIEMKMERNLFSKLLCVALEKKIDLKEILRYPLTPVPLSLCHFDGILRTTQKSKLLKHLDELVVSLAPPYIDCYIIDGNFFLHLLVDLPITFGKISHHIFYLLCNSSNSSRIDIVFDRYVTPSIKNYKRNTRSNGESNSPYVISGPQQRRPNNFMKALRNDHFKTALISYLVESWNDDALANILVSRILFVTCEEKMLQLYK